MTDIGFFARRLPGNAALRPCVWRTGERSLDMRRLFVSLRRSTAEQWAREEALTIDELTQITTELAEDDRVLANELAAGQQATTDEARRRL